MPTGIQWPGSPDTAHFELVFDAAAIRWLEQDHSCGPLLIAYRVTRCCYGKLCDVRVRTARSADWERGELVRVGTAAGRDVLMDARIIRRMPRRIRLTVRGLPALRTLSLDLTGEQWGRLLYDDPL